MDRQTEMDGWMDGWRGGWMDGWMGMDGWMDSQYKEEYQSIHLVMCIK